MKHNPNVRLVQRASNLRHYLYIARVCKLTGRLLGVEAGCRRWRNFVQAQAHYRGEGKGRHAWTDQGVQHECDHKSYRRWAERAEARALLAKLQADTKRVQYRIRRRLDKKRKSR